MEVIVDNHQKHLNYKEQTERLTRALKNEFYLEAIFIEYSILEDRTEAILKYTGSFPKQNTFVSIDRKITLIEKLAENKKAIIKNYFTNDIISELRDWRTKRNALIHALIKRNTTTYELKAIALEGQTLVKTMCRLSTNYKRKLQRQNLLVE